MILIVGLVFADRTARAQLVYIPSDGLRGLLQDQHPEIFVGDSLDTGSPALAAIDSIHLADRLVPDFEWGLEGMQYFTGLRSLMLSWQFVAPGGQAWPPNLQRLDLLSGGYNLDASAWAPLPTTLSELHVSSISFHAPFTLTGPLHTVEYNWVRAEGTAATAWPLLPEGTTSFSCRSCTAVWGDYAFPSTLEEFWWRDHLEELPDLTNTVTREITIGSLGRMVPLPSTLRTFSADFILERCLPPFPDSLMAFNVPNVNGPYYVQNIPASLELMPNTQVELATIWNSTCLGSNHITGAVFSDVNGNGVRDAAEPPIIGTVNAGPSLLSGTSEPSGAYDLVTPAGSFTITPVLGPYQSFTAAAPTADFADVGLTDAGNDLPLTLEPGIQDLQVSITASPMRPGFQARAWITYRNIGTGPMDGSVRFTYNAALDLVASMPAADAAVDNVLTFDFSALAIGEARTITVDLQAEPTAELGAHNSYEGEITPLATDHVPGDNTVVFNDSIVGSYDPNDIHVWPERLTLDDIAQGKPVIYTVRFQNTGTYLAENVVVTDTLPADVEAGSFTFMGSGHPCRWQVINGLLLVEFNGIQLPDSGANEAGSHGFLQFSVVPRGTLTAGSAVANAANIFFDFNAPVITEPAVFRVDASTGVSALPGTSMGVWPNPATDVVTIGVQGMPANAPVKVLDALGRVVRRTALAGGRVQVDLAGLPAGSYHVHVIGDQGIVARTVVKY